MMKFPPRLRLLAACVGWFVFPTGAISQDTDTRLGTPVELAQASTPAQGETKPGGFRFSYPVRDAGSGQVYTEQRQTPPPQTPTSNLEQSFAPDETAVPTRSATANKPVPGMPQGSVAAPAPATADFETVGGSGAYQMPTDIGEGIFERRPFRFSFGLTEGYNSNVNTAQDNGVSSMYTQISAGVGYEFGTSRLQLNTSLGAALAFFYNNDGLSNNGLFPTVNFVLGANYAATPRLDLSFNTVTSLLSTANYAVTGAPTSFQGSYILSNTSIGAKYLWLPKFATETIYNPCIYYFFDQPYNETQGRFEQTVSQQFLFLWKPTTSLVAEYRFNARNYFYGNNLNSYGNIALLGFNHTLNPRSTITFRVGAEQRFNQNPTPTDSEWTTYIGPFAELNFTYALGEDTTVGLVSRYGTTASGLSNYNQGQQFLLGINASRRFTRRITASAFFNYQNNFYNQPDSTVYGVEVAPDFYDNIFSAGLNVAFAINRIWSLNAGYTYNTLISTDTFQQRNYTQNIVFLGVGANF